MSHMDDISYKKKKKKRNNFLRQTKRHGKRGNFGKGRRLSEEEYNYYIRVVEQLKHVDGEEKEILVRNFFREVESEGQEKSLASNQIVSRILDDALPVADICQVLTLCRVFAEDLRPTCIDPFASHVVQTLLTLSLKYAQKGSSQKRFVDTETETEEKEVIVTDEQREEFETFLHKVGRFAYNNLEDFICNIYASHVLRSVLEVCSGVEVKSSVKSSQHSQTSHSLQMEAGKLLRVPQKLKELLSDIAVRLTKLPNIVDIIESEYGSAVLQSSLIVLQATEEDLCSVLINHIMQHGFPGITAWHGNDNQEEAEVDLPYLFQNNPATRLLEVLLKCATEEQQNRLFKEYFQGNMAALVKHRLGNFAVQTLLATWKNKEKFDEVFEEVCDTLIAAANVGHTGVVFAVTKACRRLSSNQSNCFKAISEMLDCSEPEDRQEQLACLLLRMLPHDVYWSKLFEGTVPSISLHGSLILQELLNFNRPKKIVNSLLDMKVADLQMMACDPRGSHVMDAFLSSTFVGAKNRSRMIHRCKGTFTALACSKHGSRSLEALWKAATIKHKTDICTELVSDELKLKDNQFGRPIYRNFKVKLFKRADKSDWQELQDKEEKKRKMLDDLLKDANTDEPEKKKKKKNKDKMEDDSKRKNEDDEKEEHFLNDEFLFIDTAGNISD